MNKLPTIRQIDVAVRALSGGATGHISAALAASEAYRIFTAELARRLAEESAAGRMTPEAVYATLMEAMVRLGIRIGLEMGADDA